MIIQDGSKNIEISARKLSRSEMGIGLMFSRRERAESLLFSFNKPTRMSIHSFFVFYPFLAVWLDKDNKVIEKKVVKPFFPSITCKNKYYSLVEIPINRRYSKIIQSLVGEKRFKKNKD